MRVVVSGGGTGGHIYPALALIREIRSTTKQADFLYIGTEKGLESELVTREDIPFKTIDITGFKRKISIENVKTILRFVKGVHKSKRILKDFKPDVVIGTGGYVCGPVVYAAAKLGIPTIVHEQNSIPGMTNKFLSRYVDHVAICFEEARAYFPKEKVVLTGNPRATEVVAMEKGKGLASLGLKKDVKTVLIFGGSRGAKPINDAVVKSLNIFREKPYQVLYVTGEIHFEEVKKEIELTGDTSNVIVKPFIHHMPEVLANIDLAVTRAGATTLAELTSLGVPSVLIPSPYVTNNHQEKNARALSDHGAALLLLEKDLTANSLITHIDTVMDDEQLASLSKNAAKLGMPDAAQRLSQLMVQLVQTKK